ncbi:bile acid:Na+ symporter, BASS family [Marinospirillum celere]|uniref:Bile acid:Na+ symporter, BASS family n=1 Tax=Marinospirillum celere TaxID=1122252 RepID=A0A1I1ETP0_9GAMM|nr:bile acid:sodium symporter family protein [Marinospirillum celere]SFB90441.1 bile acid:Na+ symporter, BASS family [Marinospirillum celere]
MFETLTQIGLPLALIFIMWGVGLTLSPVDFKRVIQQPRGFFLGAFAQLALLPLIALLIIYLFGLRGEIAIGLFILSLCPGGVTSNLYSFLSKGDVGLSVSLTAMVGFITPFTIPLLGAWSINFFSDVDPEFQLPIFKTWLQLMIITVIPVLIGMATRARWSYFAERFEPKISFFSVLVLALLIFTIAVDLGADLWQYILISGPAVVALNLSTMLLGYLLGKWLLHREDQSRTISIEVGLQNGTLALLVTTGILQSSAMSVAPSVYSLLMFATATFFTLAVLHKDKRQQATSQES